MSSISITTVSDHLKNNGWKLLSTEYKNLQTELEMECPKGHKHKQTYAGWRKLMSCPICEEISQRVPDKNGYRVLALDAATLTTGYSIFEGERLIKSGIYKANSKDSIDARIDTMKQWMLDMIEKVKPDMVGIEDIQLKKEDKHVSKITNVAVFQKLANLQGVLINALYEIGLPYELVHATEWRAICGITGKNRDEDKLNTLRKVKAVYNKECTEDEADAICIGKYFAYKHRQNNHKGWGSDTL